MVLPKNIVLLGNVGQGKSFLTEKLTRAKNISANSMGAVTQVAKMHESRNGYLRIFDTPGVNPSRSEMVDHNIHIARALNSGAQHAIVVIVQAHTRIMNISELFEKFVERFYDLGLPLGAVVTQMDKLSWQAGETREKFEAEVRTELSSLGGNMICFSGAETDAGVLEKTIYDMLPSTAVKVEIDSQSFLHHFKIGSKDFRVMRVSKVLVGGFEKKVDAFLDIFKGWQQADEKKDLLFEFFAFCKEHIVEIQMQFAKELDFNFMGDDAEIQDGQVATMTSELKTALSKIRRLMHSYQNDKGFQDLRKCPHCGVVWAKVVGCNGSTTCGSKVTGADGTGKMANFTFKWIEASGQWDITASGVATKNAPQTAGSTKNVGCGKTIHWGTMTIVQNPEGLESVPDDIGSMKDLHNLPPTRRRPFAEEFEMRMRGANKN